MRVMRFRAWSAMVLFLLSVGLLYSQPVPRTNPNNEKKEEKQELGPATAKTKEEVENSVKAPVAIPALPTAAPVDPKTYVIGPEDILAIRVWREPELSSAVQVRPGRQDHVTARRGDGGCRPDSRGTEGQDR